MKSEQIDRLVGGLAVVHDEALGTAAGSAEAERLFRELVSTPVKKDRPRRRLLVAALAGAVLVAGPALALRGHIVHLFAEREEAPPPVAASFDELKRGVPEKWRLSGSAREVLNVSTPDGPIVVWAAPVRSGGFCYAVGTGGHQGFASTCVDRSAPLDIWPFSVSRPDDELVGGPMVAVGFTLDHDVSSVQIRFDNGERTTVPLRWISAPLDAGFFAVWTPRRYWLDGKERFEAVALNAVGLELAHSAVEVGAPTG